MKRALLVLLILLMASVPHAGTLSWRAPATYTDGSAIYWEDVAEIVYQPAISSSPVGPWSNQATTGPGATFATVPYPPAGSTWYYTCRAFLKGQASAYATPASYTTPYAPPEPAPAPGKGWGKGGKKK